MISPYGQNPSIAQDNTYSHSMAPKLSKVTFNPPAGDKPKMSHAGASRRIGQCISSTANPIMSFSPVLPASEQALTVASHPTVLAYLPRTSAQQVLFSWREENGEDHYQTILPINSHNSVISLTLPKDAPPLEVGKNYNWALALICDGRLHPDTPTIEGHIKRVTLEDTVNNRLANADLLETAIIYGKAGIWYETVATLAELKNANPGDRNLASNWEDLLTSVGLKEISQVPISTKP